MPRGNPNFKPKYGGESTKVVRLPHTLADKLVSLLGEGVQADEVMRRVSELSDTPRGSAASEPSIEYQQLKVEREELDREVERLVVKVGDLDLEKQNLAEQLAQTQTELAEARSQSVSPDVTKLDQENENLLSQLQRANSENENLLKKLQDTRAELKEVRSQKTDAVLFEMPEPAELLNQFRKKLPKSKVTLREVETLLELI